MDTKGKQLHPNWRALATVHIPHKLFVKEGTRQSEQGTLCSTSKWRCVELHGVDGEEIKEFYQDLVSKETPFKKKENSQAPAAFQQIDQRYGKSFDMQKFFLFSVENRVDLLKEIDYRNQDVNVRDCYGWTALMMATCEGSVEAERFLLELGVNRDAEDKWGKTAADLAQIKGQFNIEQLLQKPTEKEFNVSGTNEYEELKSEPFFCEVCQQTFTETTRKKHQTSTLHQFNMKSTPSTYKLNKFTITPRNKGLQLMVKQGWDKESGLGPSNSGRLYPVKTVIRKARSGLGTVQAPAKVTHFQPYDGAAVQGHKSGYRNSRNRIDIRKKVVEWKRDRHLRNELN